MVDICHKASLDVLPETPNNNLYTHTHWKHTEAEPCLALNGLPRPDLLVTTMITPMGTGGIWLSDMCVCEWLSAYCECSTSRTHVCLLPCVAVLASLLARVYLCASVCVCVLLAWRGMPQGAQAASEGPTCPQSLTICALLVVIKVSNSEVSWGLAKRGQKMSLRRSPRWAAMTIFTYLYTLIVFALLPWHWVCRSLARAGGGKNVRRTEWKTALHTVKSNLALKWIWVNEIAGKRTRED